MSSQIPLVIDALQTKLSADITCGPLMVPPGPLLIPKMKYIRITGEGTTSSTPQATGGQTFEDTFQLTVLIWIQQASPNGWTKVRDLAYSYANAVKAVIDADQFIKDGGNNATVQRGYVTNWHIENGLDDAGQQFQMGITLTVTCTARVG